MLALEAEAHRLVIDLYAETQALPDAWALLDVIERRLAGKVSAEAIAHAEAEGLLECDGRRVRLLPRGRALFKVPLAMRMTRREHRPPTPGVRRALPSRR
jgi:hypothetical protein